MIKLQDLSPSIYYTKSRDFQLLGRLFDIVLNSVKTNIDTIYYLPLGSNADETMLNLLALTLGFKSLRHYNAKQLAAICSALPLIMKQKGSIGAVFTAVNVLLQAEGIDDTMDYSISNGKLTIYVPETLSSFTLIYDLLNYLVPAGMSVELIKELKEKRKAKTIVTFSDSVKIYKAAGGALMSNDEYTAMLGKLADVDTADISDVELKDTAGLLANSAVYKFKDE